jgi:predicted nucleic acid-binding protein
MPVFCWDASALVKLVVEEAESAALRRAMAAGG